MPRQITRTGRVARTGLEKLVLSQDLDPVWVQVDGTAEVLDGEAAVEPLVDSFRCLQDAGSR